MVKRLSPLERPCAYCGDKCADGTYSTAGCPEEFCSTKCAEEGAKAFAKSCEQVIKNYIATGDIGRVWQRAR